MSFKKGKLKIPRTATKHDDLDANKKPKIDTEEVWLVDVWMPRKFVDTALDGKEEFSGDVDTAKLSDAYESGLDDETNIGQDNK